MKPAAKSLLPIAACTALALTLAACGGQGSQAAANSGGMPTVRIMVGGLDKQIYLPVMLAQRLGYYKAQGLDVKLSDEPAGVDAEQAMLSGKVDAVVGFYDHTIDLQSNGESTESVVQLLQVPGEVEMVRTDEADRVKSPADFAGKRLGVTGLDSSTNFLTQYLEAKNGIEPGQATTVAVGAGTTFLTAMKNKKIDAGMTTEPTVSMLEQQHLAKPLIDMRSTPGTEAALGGHYPASCVYLTTAYVRKNPVVVQKLVNAFVETLQWIQTHGSPEVTSHMPADYYSPTGKRAYIKALELEKDMYSPDGLMPSDGPRTVLTVLSAFDPAVKGHTVNLSKTYTNEFVNKTQ